MTGDPGWNSTLEDVEDAVTNTTAARDKILEWGDGVILDVLDDLLLVAKNISAASDKLVALYEKEVNE